MDEDDDFDRLIEILIADGCMRWVDDEYLEINGELLKELHPEVYQAFVDAAFDEAEAAVLALVEKGLVEFAGVDDDGEITYELTPIGQKYVEGQA